VGSTIPHVFLSFENRKPSQRAHWRLALARQAHTGTVTHPSLTQGWERQAGGVTGPDKCPTQAPTLDDAGTGGVITQGLSLWDEALGSSDGSLVG